VRHHHEAFDGSGYPDGLSGEHIPLCSRIISIADVYDAMTSTRAYHRGCPHEEAMHLLAAERAKFDPRVFAQFEQMSGAIRRKPA
jgi:HD-GYP domain-containing protein (c-di-GMP phosphodiesterase class II)